MKESAGVLQQAKFIALVLKLILVSVIHETRNIFVFNSIDSVASSDSDEFKDAKEAAPHKSTCTCRSCYLAIMARISSQSQVRRYLHVSSLILYMHSHITHEVVGRLERPVELHVVGQPPAVVGGELCGDAERLRGHPRGGRGARRPQKVLQQNQVHQVGQLFQLLGISYNPPKKTFF
mgnify:CR=1 FL=1